jgi:hypothetical protein
MEPDRDDDVRRWARRQARMRLVFYGHAATYLVVIATLFIINAIASPNYWWAVWPALGWGIGVAMHGLAVFVIAGEHGRRWEDRTAARLYDQYRIEPQPH